MSRFIPKLALVATVATVGVACSDVDLDTPFGTATQAAVVGGVSAGLSANAINEGSSVIVFSDGVCVDSGALPVTLTVLENGATTANSLTIEPEDPGRFVPGDGTNGCALLQFVVCSTTNPCNIPVLYLDNPAATPPINVDGTVELRLRVAQGAGSPTTSGPLPLVVNNVDPTVTVDRASANLFEGTIHTINVTVNDAGGLANEIAKVTIAITTSPGDVPANAQQAFPAETIECTCNGTEFTCASGVQPVALESGSSSTCRGLLRVRSRWLNNFDYTIRAEVNDKDGGSANDSNGPHVITTVTPAISATISNGLDNPVGDIASLVSHSASPLIDATTVFVTEGFQYGLAFNVSDVGTDAIRWNWELAGRAFPGPDPDDFFSGSFGPPATIIDGPLVLTLDQGEASLAQDSFRWNQGDGGFEAFIEEVGGGSSGLAVTIEVVDVNPINTEVTRSAGVPNDDGTQVTFTVTTESGDFGSGFDPIRDDGYDWEISLDGGTTFTALAAVPQVVRVDGGCDENGTSADNGATGQATCTITFLYGDAPYSYIIRATVHDEESSAFADTERNFVPKLNFTVAPDVVIDEASSVTVNFSSVDEAGDPAFGRFYSVRYGDTDNSTDTTLPLAVGVSGSFEPFTYLDNKKCPFFSPTSGRCVITVRVCEVDGSGDITACDQEIENIDVNNVAPTAVATAPTGTIVEGHAFVFDGEFSDPATNLDEAYSLVWAWDDGEAPLVTARSVAVNGIAYAAREAAPDVAGIPFSNVGPDGLQDVNLTLTVTDGDTGVSVGVGQVTTVDVIDAQPTITIDNLADTTVGEGTTITFTANAESGDAGSGADPLNLNSYVWELEIDGGAPQLIAPTGVPGLVAVAGCTNTGTGDGVASSNTCTLTFLDADVDIAYKIHVRISDEDSDDSAESGVITVRNVAPLLVFTVASRGATLASGDSINEADEVTVTVTFEDPSLALDSVYTLNVDYGDTDGTPAEEVALTNPTTVTPGTFDLLSFTYVDNKKCAPVSATQGVCEITVTVCEGDDGNVGACDVKFFELFVNNVVPTAFAAAPTTTLPDGPLLLVEGQPFNLNGSFTDPAGAEDDLPLPGYESEWIYDDGPGGDPATETRTITRTATFAQSATGANIAGERFVNVDNDGLDVTFTLTVTDGDGGVSQPSTVTATVRDNRPSIAITNTELINVDTADDDAREHASKARITVAVAPETTDDLLTTLTVTWGDGTSSVLTGVAAAPILGQQFLNTGDQALVITKPTRYTDNCDESFNALRAVNEQHDCDADGNFVITVTVNDEDSSDRRNPITGQPEGRVLCDEGFTAPCQQTSLDVTNEDPVVVASIPAVESIDSQTGVVTAQGTVVAEGQAATIVLTIDDISSDDIVGGAGDLMEFEFNWGDGTVETFRGTETNDSDPAHDDRFGPGTESDGKTRVGRGAHIYTTPGLFTVTVTVTDKDGGFVVVIYPVDVINLAPVLTDLFVTQPAFEGIELSALAVVENRGADTLDYTFSTSEDECDPTDGVTDADFLAARQASAVFKTSFEDNSSGTLTHTVCVRVCDDDNQPNSCVFGSAVVDVRNVDPVITSFVGGSVDEGEALTFAVIATDVAADLDFDIVIACGNGEVADASNACSYSQSGGFTAVVTVTDKDGGTATRSTPVAVRNVAPSAPVIVTNAGATQGTLPSVTVSATDAGGDAFTFVFDNGAVSVATLSQATQILNVTAVGGTNLTVRACDVEGACSVPTPFTVNITNAPPTISTLLAPSLVRQGAEFTVVTLATDPGNDTLTFTYAFENLGGTTPVGTLPAPSTNNAASVTLNEAGRILVTVTVTDDNGGSATRNAFVDVENVPGRLVSFIASDSRIDEGNTVLFEASAIDPFNVGTTFDFDFDCGNGTVGVIDPLATNDLTAVAECDYGDNGSFVATVTAEDNNGNVDTRTLVIVVDNLVPTGVTLTSDATDVDEGDTVTFTATATDVAADVPLTFEYDFNGDGVVDLRTTNTTASFVFRDNGTFTANVRVCDKDGGCATADADEFDVDNVAPTIVNVTAPTEVPVGSPITVSVDASDAGNDALTFSFAFTGADTATINSGASNVGTFLPTVAGDYTLIVTVSDGTANTASAPILITVENEAPRLLTFTTTPTILDEADGGAEVVLAATASDRGGSTLTFTFDCGDGSPPVAGANRTCSYANSGTKLVSVTVSDGDLSDTRTATVIVNNVAPSAVALARDPAAGNINEGGSITFTATASDVDALTFAFDFNGDGVVDEQNATGTATFIYGDNGVFSATVTACDSDGACTALAAPVTINVDNVAPSAVSLTPSLATVNEGSTVTFTAAATDVAADLPLTFEYDFDGDSIVDFRTTNTTASFTYRNNGTFVASVRALDKDGGAETATTTITVNNVAPVLGPIVAPASVLAGSAATVTASATDVGTADTLSFTFVFTDRDNNVTTVGPQLNNVASAILASSGPATVQVTVTDGDGGSDSGTANINVQNVAPVLVSFTQTPSVLNEGGATPVELDATHTDLGGGAVTFTFDCGDGAGFTASSSCTYVQSGTRTVAVRVTDRDGLSDTRSALVVVNNVAPVLTAPGSQTVPQGAVATFTATGTDVTGDTVRIEYDFNGDGIFDAIAASGANVTTTYFGRGGRTLKVRACDQEGACSATEDVAVTVDNVAPVVSAVAAHNTIVNAPVTVSVTASDAGNDALTFTYAFVRDGGTPIDPVTQASPVLVKTFTESGTYTVTVTANDGLLTSTVDAASTATFLVTNINTDLVVTATPSSLTEGDSTEFSIVSLNGVGPFTVNLDVNGDGDFDDAVDVTGLACDEASLPDDCTVVVDYLQNRAGDADFRVLVSVTDLSSGTINTTLVTVEVANAAPTLDAGADETIEELFAFTRDIAGGVDDVGVLDTHTFSLVSGPAGLTVSAAGVVSWTPTFNDEGVNLVTVRATDNDGATGDASFTLTVTIIDANNNGVSDTLECELLGRDQNGDCLLLDDDADEVDSDNDGISDFEEVLAGTNPNSSDVPRAPTIISPDGVTVTTATPVLKIANAFSPRGLALTYTFVVEGDNDFELVIEDVASGQTTTSVTVPTALVDGSYTWFAFAKDGTRNLANTEDIEGLASDNGVFTVNAVNTAPPAPAALSPANNASFLEGTIVTLEARAVIDPDGDAVTYTFQVGSGATANFSTIVATSEARAVPVFTIPEPLPVGSYHWRASASDGLVGGNSGFGTVGTFTIEAIVVNVAPTAPGIVGPSNTTIDTTQATLTITASTDANNDTLQYEFEHATNAAFANATVSGLQAGLTFAVTSLAEDTQHFWRARAFDGSLYSDWSNATFVVDAVNGTPSGLALISPADGLVLAAAPTSFTATEASDPEGDTLTYTVIVSASAELTNPIISVAATVENGVVRLPAPATLATSLDNGETYFWSVTVSDGTNQVTAPVNSFSLAPDDVRVAGGGCGCSATDDNGAAGAFVAAIGLLALRRRRRR